MTLRRSNTGMWRLLGRCSHSYPHTGYPSRSPLPCRLGGMSLVSPSHMRDSLGALGAARLSQRVLAHTRVGPRRRHHADRAHLRGPRGPLGLGHRPGHRARRPEPAARRAGAGRRRVGGPRCRGPPSWWAATWSARSSRRSPPCCCCRAPPSSGSSPLLAALHGSAEAFFRPAAGAHHPADPAARPVCSRPTPSWA